METLKRAAETLERAEASLRELVAKSAESGDYASVVQIARWAIAIRDLVKPNTSTRESLAVVTGGRAALNSKHTSVKQGKRARSKGRAHNGYPRFFRRGDQLVRVAWSRSEKKEYQHKAPLSVIRRLADALVEKASADVIVSMDAILPLSVDGAAIPDYQVYVSLSWFREIGVVKQNGRQGYSLDSLREGFQVVESAWSSLALLKHPA